MSSVIQNAAFHHIELPCDDLDVAERFYVIVFGAQVYMRRDSTRRPEVPTGGRISQAEELGFDIDATYMKIGDGIRLGFLKRPHDHLQREIDHLAFAIDGDLPTLWQRLTELAIEVIDLNSSRMIIRDPFGMQLELWPRTVLESMGLA